MSPARVDVHANFGPSLYGSPVSAPRLLRAMDELEIEISVLVPQKPPGYHFHGANEAALMAVEDHPDRLRALCRVDPWKGGEAVVELIRCLQKGAVGLFLHPLQECYPVNEPHLVPLMEICRDHQVPVMIAGGHVRVSTAWQIGELAGRHPEVTFVATSGGQINISGIALAEAETLLEEHPNVYMDTSGIYREDFIEDSAARFGAERILFGSGSPPLNRDLELRRAEWAHLSEDEVALILGGNARRLGLLGKEEA